MRSFCLFVFCLLFLGSWAESDFSALIKGLDDGDFKVRKASFKQALALSFEDLDSLIVLLSKSENPELEYVATKLERKYKELKKTRTVSLPKEVSLKLNRSSAYAEFDYVNMDMSYEEGKYSFDAAAISLQSVSYGGKTIKDEGLSNITFSHSKDNGRVKLTWRLSRGLDNVLPYKTGKYKVTVCFKTPETTWRATGDFERKCSDEASAEAFAKAKLHKFFRNYLYRESIEASDVKGLLAFCKTYPKSKMTQYLQSQIENAARYCVYNKDYSSETRGRLCEILNEIGNGSVLRFIAQEEKRGRRADRVSRLKELKALLKEKILSAKGVMSLEIYKEIKPFQRKAIKVTVHNGESRYRDLKIIRAKLNGKKLKLKNFLSWEYEKKSNGRYHLYAPISLIPHEAGTYKLDLVLAANNTLYQLNKEEFRVKLQGFDKEAVKFYKENGLNQLSDEFDVTLAKLKACSRFVTDYPKSYLKNYLLEDLAKFVKKDLDYRLDQELSIEERELLADVLIKGGAIKFFKQAVSSLDNRRNSIDQNRVISFYLKQIAKSAKKAPEYFRVRTQYKDNVFSPYEGVNHFLQWQSSEYLNQHVSSSFFLKDGKFYTSRDFQRHRTFDRRYELYGGNLDLEKEGGFKFRTYFMAKENIFFVESKASVRGAAEDKEILRVLDLAKYNSFKIDLKSYEFAIDPSDEELLKVLATYPRSHFTANVFKDLLLFVRNDVNGRKKVMTPEDRKIAFKYIPQICGLALKRLLNQKWHSNHDKSILEKWLEVIASYKFEEAISGTGQVQFVFPPKAHVFEDFTLKLKVLGSHLDLVKLEDFILDVNGESVGQKAGAFWAYEKSAEGLSYTASYSEKIRLGKEGDYNFTARVKSGHFVYKIPTKSLAVHAQEVDDSAVHFYNDRLLDELGALTKYDEKLMNSVDDFFKFYSDSKLKDRVLSQLDKLILKDLSGELRLKTEERQRLLSFVLLGKSTEALLESCKTVKVAKEQEDLKSLAVARFWRDNLLPFVKEGSKDVKLSLSGTYRDLKVTDVFAFSLKWDKTQVKAWEVLAFSKNQEMVDGDEFGGHGPFGNSRHFHVYFPFLDYEQDFEGTVYLSTGRELMKFSGLKRTLERGEADIAVQKEIDLKAYAALMRRLYEVDSTLKAEDEKVLEVLARYPKSEFTKNNNHYYLTSFPINDLKGKKKNLSDEAESLAIKYIAKICPERAIELLDRFKGQSERKDFWRRSIKKELLRIATPAGEKFTLRAAREIRPYMREPFILACKDTRQRIYLVKAELDGEEILNGHEIKLIDRREHFGSEQLVYFGEGLLQNFRGRGQLQLYVSNGRNREVYRLEPFHFEVKVPEENLAFQYFEDNKLSDFENSRVFGLDQQKLITDFLDRFPKSYLCETLGAYLSDFVHKDFYGSVEMTDEERQVVLKNLSQVNFAKVFRTACKRERNARKTKARNRAIYWKEALAPFVKEAPSGLKMETQHADLRFRPLEEVQLTLTWEEGLVKEGEVVRVLAWEMDKVEPSYSELIDYKLGPEQPQRLRVKPFEKDFVGRKKMTVYVDTGLGLVKFSNLDVTLFLNDEDKKFFDKVSGSQRLLDWYWNFRRAFSWGRFSISDNNEKYLTALESAPKSFYSQSFLPFFKEFLSKDLKGESRIKEEARERLVKTIRRICREEILKYLKEKTKQDCDEEILSFWEKALSEKGV